MEKIIAALWAPQNNNGDEFNQETRNELVPHLKKAGAKHIRVNLRDADVAPAQPLNQKWQSPQQDVIIQFWVQSSHPMFFAPIEAALAQHSAKYAAWLVMESTIIANQDHPPAAGERSYGWSQMAFLNFRDDISYETALDHWRDVHTEVAIATQSNFEYVQHLITRPLTKNAPRYQAIVEECFPPEAMTDPAAFFDAVGDEARFADHTRRMMESCDGFLKFGELDVIPTSQFIIHD